MEAPVFYEGMPNDMRSLFEHETPQRRNMNFHISCILPLWLGFTWSEILAVRSAALHTRPVRVVSCHGIGPEPYTWQISTLSPPADNANTGKRCVAPGQRSFASIWMKKPDSVIVCCFDTGVSSLFQVINWSILQSSYKCMHFCFFTTLSFVI